MEQPDTYQLCAFADEADPKIEEQIRALQENGISLLELRGIGEKNVADLSEEEAKTIAARLQNNHISVWSIGSPIGKIKITDDFQPELERMEHIARLSVIFGCKHIRVFSFYLPSDAAEEQIETYRYEVFQRMQQLLQIAKQYHLTLCHENEKGIWGDTVARCLALHQAFPDLRAVYDPANFAQCRQEPLHAFTELQPYIAYVHIKDVNASDEIVVPGNGICQIPKMLCSYLQHGGQVITLEPHLMEFCGLAALENGEKSHIANQYDTTRAAFDDAVLHLKQILTHISDH